MLQVIKVDEEKDVIEENNEANEKKMKEEVERWFQEGKRIGRQLIEVCRDAEGEHDGG